MDVLVAYGALAALIILVIVIAACTAGSAFDKAFDEEDEE